MIEALHTSAQHNQDLSLLYVPQNDEHFVSNLFISDKSGMPKPAQLLASLKLKAVGIVSIVRTVEFASKIVAVARRFATNAHWDPLLDQFKDRNDPKVNVKCLAPNPPGFVTPARYVFEDYTEWARIAGVTALRKGLFSSKTSFHGGQAAFVPIEASYRGKMY